MPAFNSLNTMEFNEKYDVDKDGYLNLVSVNTKIETEKLLSKRSNHCRVANLQKGTSVRVIVGYIYGLDVVHRRKWL